MTTPFLAARAGHAAALPKFNNRVVPGVPQVQLRGDRDDALCAARAGHAAALPRVITGLCLGSPRYSYAETVTTPFVRRALVTLPHFKGVDPAAIAREKGLDRLSAWFTVRPSQTLSTLGQYTLTCSAQGSCQCCVLCAPLWDKNCPEVHAEGRVL